MIQRRDDEKYKMFFTNVRVRQSFVKILKKEYASAPNIEIYRDKKRLKAREGDLSITIMFVRCRLRFTVAIEHARDSSLYAAHVDSFFLREIVYLSLRRVARGKNLRQIVSFAPRSIFLFSYLFSYPRANHIPLHQEDAFWSPRETSKARQICMRTG